MQSRAVLFLLVSLSALTSGMAAGAGDLKTDLGKAVVPLEEIIPGGPPPDGIPAIDRPAFVSPSRADTWLKPKEPVVALEVSGDSRAYPLQILVWHEIVNDTVGGTPVAITYCPLCNSGVVFDRRLDARVLDFGTSGKLYKSDLVMYDRQTHSLWAQMEGRAIVGTLAGARLEVIPANTVSYEDWKAAHPTGTVLSRETGFARRYGVNPYTSYDAPWTPPFAYAGRLDERLPPKERVVGVVLDGAARAYPWSGLARRRVVDDTLAGHPLVIFYRPGALSALDAERIEESRSVGATAVYVPVVRGTRLTFELAGEGFRDRETGTQWNLLGRGVSGALAGQRLRPLPHVDAFWFAWAAFHPDTSVHPFP
jgi:hypothetical protein